MLVQCKIKIKINLCDLKYQHKKNENYSSLFKRKNKDKNLIIIAGEGRHGLLKE